MNAPSSKPEELALTISLPPAEVISRHGQSALALVEAFEVVDDATYALAGEEVQAINKRVAMLIEQRFSITRPFDTAKAKVMEWFRGPTESLQHASEILKAKMVRYQQALRMAAEQQRLENERAAEAERARLRAEAAELEAQGRAGEAEVKTRVSEIVVANAPQQQMAPKVSGIAVKEGGFDVEVADLLALVRHIAEHPEDLALVKPSDAHVRAHVKARGGMACKTPGLRISPKTTIAASRK